MDWKHEIRRAYAVVIWFFQEVAARHRSGIYPEGPLAIKEYRLLTPGSNFALTFDASGVYSLFCTLHPDMVANVTVD